ncbi:hypothetical protein [Nodosilinea sp. P-1105]|uniref:hypothetical protein n=1 Tax=Nodosilinea sp. P-1105 TaxID=2546229 RepID=UPI00146B75F0|nr:hypothetical protein [Nodosilinea sp. P-1105]NMF85071.1 hypothetical protein [Nodosilinea sp. P-1105]
MDITDSTKTLIQHVQPLKLKYADLTSQTFIDFYCQCLQGIDYLFPQEVKATVRLLDILNWFCQCIDQKQPSTLIRLMWNDVVGPTLNDYTADEAIETQLTRIFEQGTLHTGLAHWDLERRPDGSVNLPLRSLLAEIAQLELAQGAHPLQGAHSLPGGN